ncbi:alpha/beta hydrolase [Leptospira perolatii]|uniref:Alpha/beta hydrolase n=1 Tax=Leptospira perolatii TaxID=2023191 RepID=A0A2M9ZT00_9LEPT|nr:alpha/beta hydrolase [Leptospira perolatii]PJZ71595.1 alpha/beta hydrolase [Leptospira perolatii]PJZ75210.1 alpha/beta hydrolase [Leptospira perolatii]
MSYLWKAAKFSYYCQSFTPPSVKESEIVINFDNQSIPAILYTPEGNSAGTILAVNGLAYLGNKDPRFASVCKAACSVGFTVISPFLEEVTQFRIETATIDRIRGLILKVSNDPKLCPQGKVSYIAPSFSGSMGLIAASDPSTSRRLASFLAIGAYCDLDSTLNYLMTTKNGDEYGRMILLYNFLKFVVKDSKEIESAIYACILDGSFGRESQGLPEILKKIHPENRKIFEDLRTNEEYRLSIWSSILKNAGAFQSFLKDLQVKDKLEQISFPVSIVHGLEDNVVPSVEALRLSQNLPKGKSKLLVTPLLSHGDIGISLKTIPAIAQLIQGFAYFFKYATQNGSQGSVPVEADLPENSPEMQIIV